MERFPEHGLSKLARGYQLSKKGDIDQAFDLFSEGLDACPDSLFGYQCLSWIYYESKEYETGLEYATRGKDVVKKIKLETGISKSK
jgi:tetratricopeptide (TPR) repeat protein